MRTLIASLRPLLVIASMFLIVIMAMVGALLMVREVATPLRDWIIMLVAATGGAAAVWLAGATAFRGLYGDNLRAALRDHTFTLLRMNRPVQIIENGETVLPKDAQGPQMGPRMVILRGSVATLFRGARQVRAEGPGVIWAETWEYVAHSHDARPKQRDLCIDSVLTKDQHIPVAVDLSLTYGLAMPDAVIRGDRPLNEGERAVVSQLDLRAPNPEAATLAIVEQEVRRAVAQLAFDNLLAPGALRRLDHDLRERANLRLRPLGVNVRSLTVIRATPAREMLSAVSQAQAEMILELTRAEAWQGALQMVADGYRGAKNTEAMTDDDIKREVLRRVLDALARAPKEANSALSASVVQSLVNGVPMYPYPGGGPQAGGGNSQSGPKNHN